MLTKKEREQIRIWRSWERYEASPEGKESANWTVVLRCLEGTATKEEHNSLDGPYASYGPEGLTVVSPAMGAVVIPPSDRARTCFGQQL